MSTSINMYVGAVILSCIAILSLIVFVTFGDDQALFSAIASASGAASIFAIRANVWNKKKVIQFEPNSYYWLALIFLVVLEFVCFYLFIYSDSGKLLSSFFLNEWGKYFVLIIPIWIVTLYNLKK